MKYLVIWSFLFALSGCASTRSLSAAECAARVEALQGKAATAWKEAEGKGDAEMERAASIAADSAQAAADLELGPCQGHSLETGVRHYTDGAP
jgi:hypothetical protein